MQRSKRILAMILAAVLFTSLFGTLALAASPVVAGKVVIGGEDYRIPSGTQETTIIVDPSFDSTVWKSFISGKMWMTATNGMEIEGVLYTNLPTGTAIYTAARDVFTIDDIAAIRPTNVYLSNITQTSALQFVRGADHVFSVLPLGATNIGQNIDIDADKTELRDINIIVQQTVSVNITGAIAGCEIKANTTAYDTGKNTYNSAGTATTLVNGSTIYVDTGAGYQDSPILNVTAPAGYAAVYNGTHYPNGTTINLGKVTAAANVGISFVKTTEDTYTLTYDANGGTNAPTDANTYAGTATAVLKSKADIGSMAKAGKAFIGWSATARADLNASDTASGIITQIAINGANKIVYAVWGADADGNGTWDGADTPKYTLTYNANGGTNAPTDANTYSGTAIAVLKSKADIGSMAKAGKAFIGWSATAHADLSASDTVPGIITQIAINGSNKIVYAVWGVDEDENGTWDTWDNQTYSLTYDANGGTNAPTDANPYAGDATVSLKSKSDIGTMAKAGYAFVGWSETAEADLGASDAAPAMITQIAINGANKTVYAVWGADEDENGTWDPQDVSYTLSFNLDYTGAPAIDSQSLKRGEAPTAVSNPTREGYTFTGWRNAATNASVNLTSFTMPANDVVLIAKWAANVGGIDPIRPIDRDDPGNKNPDDADEWLVPGNNGEDNNGQADDIIVNPNEDSDGNDNSYINDDGNLVLPDGGQGTDSNNHTTIYPPGTVIGPNNKMDHIVKVEHIEVDIDGNPTGVVLKAEEEIIFSGNTFTAEVGLFNDADDKLFAYVGSDPGQSITLTGDETAIPSITLKYVKQSENVRVVTITVKLQGTPQDVPGYPGGICEFAVKEGATVIFNAPAVHNYNATPTMATVEANAAKTVVFNYSQMENAPPELIKEDHSAYMIGDDFGRFNPDNNITRAEAAMMFFRLLKDNNPSKSVSFTDVPAGAWYAEAVHVLASKHIIVGYPDGSFGPDKTITRAEFTTLVSRFEDLITGNIQFSDVTSSHWAYRYINSAAAKGWINGYEDGTFRTEKQITRAEAAKLVNKLLGRAPDRNYIDLNTSTLRLFPDVSKLHWAFYDIVEASNGHNYNRDSQGNEIWTGLK